MIFIAGARYRHSLLPLFVHHASGDGESYPAACMVNSPLRPDNKVSVNGKNGSNNVPACHDGFKRKKKRKRDFFLQEPVLFRLRVITAAHRAGTEGAGGQQKCNRPGISFAIIVLYRTK